MSEEEEGEEEDGERRERRCSRFLNLISRRETRLLPLR